MKGIRKIVSLVLALIMIFGMTNTVFAAEPTTAKGEGNFTITLNNDKAGHTYAAYQVFSGDLLVTTETVTAEDGTTTTVETKTLSNVEWGSGIDATKVTALVEELKKIEGLGLIAESVTAEDVANALSDKEKEDDGTVAQAFADVVAKYLSFTVSGTSEEQKNADGKITGYQITGLKAGYYLVKDKDTITGNDAYTRYILEVVDDVEATVKSVIPSVEKKILEGSKKVDANNAGIGKTVSYEITGNVPDYTGYNHYYYVINDTLSNGLTFNDDITVTIVGAEKSKTLRAGEDYTVYKDESADVYTFQIAFKDIMAEKIGAQIVVRYSATVNENAVVGSTGNPNTVNLTYSNDPNYEYKGEEKPGTNEPTGVGPNDITVTYVTKIEILKKDENGQFLEGAEFTLTGTSKETLLTGKGYYVEAEKGTYYLLKDGTYTETEPTNDTVKRYVSTDKKYEKQTTTEITEVETAVVLSGTSDAYGEIKFTGLGEGTYTIEETVVPAGYNKAENVTVIIGCNEPKEIITGEEKAGWTKETGSTETVDLKDGVYTVTIENQKGAVLPSTGGMGTTIFYLIGGALVLGAVVLLITKKRMSVEK